MQHRIALLMLATLFLVIVRCKWPVSRDLCPRPFIKAV